MAPISWVLYLQSSVVSLGRLRDLKLSSAGLPGGCWSKLKKTARRGDMHSQTLFSNTIGRLRAYATVAYGSHGKKRYAVMELDLSSPKSSLKYPFYTKGPGSSSWGTDDPHIRDWRGPYPPYRLFFHVLQTHVQRVVEFEGPSAFGPSAEWLNGQQIKMWGVFSLKRPTALKQLYRTYFISFSILQNLNGG